MKIAGIKKKKVKVQNIPVRLEERIDEFKEATLALDCKIDSILKEKSHLLFLDECVFASRNFNKYAWSAPNQNIHVYDRSGD